MVMVVPRAGLEALPAYVGGESAIGGRETVIKLSSNEGALGASPLAIAALREAAARAHRYPDGGSTALRQALAARYGLDAAVIVCGCGSDDLLGLLCRAYAGPGDEVLYTEHGFLMFPILTRSVGAVPVAVPEQDRTADVDALLAHVTPKTRIVFIANPNNPTGTYLPAEELDRLRDGLPADILLVVDAAYVDFVDRPDYRPGDHLVARGNTVVTRTFSKIYGLGGVRLGWAHCPPATADVLNRLRHPFNVSGPAQAAGLAALADEAFYQRCREHNARWRDWTTTALRDLGFTVPDSVANFFLVHFPAEPGRDAVAADDFLKSRGIIARRVASYGLPDWLRITIGLEEEMRAVVAALGAFRGKNT